MFGGNSNWRGPIWFPINYLLIEALEKYHHFYGDNVQVECPDRLGKFMNLQQVALEIADAAARHFPARSQTAGARATATIRASSTIRTGAITCSSTNTSTATPARGLGAAHQTGWTALITRCINMVARVREE